MDRPVYFGFISNAVPNLRNWIVETLLSVWTENGSVRPILINGDPGIALPVNNRRNTGDDPVSKFGSSVGPANIPYLRLDQAADFFEEAVKSKSPGSLKERAVVVLKDAVPSPGEISLYDALCLAVTCDPASIAFVYGAIRAMRTVGKRIPVRVLVVGVSEIETAAMFYDSLLRDLKEIVDGFVDVMFAGFLSHDQEEFKLASAYGVPPIEAFPKGVLHGQGKYAAGHLFKKDISEMDEDWPEREKRLIRLARSRG